MIKFKILRWALKLFITLCLLIFASTSYAIYSLQSENLKTPLELRHFYVAAAMTALLTIGLYLVHQSFTSFIRRSYFNSKSAIYMSSGGYVLGAIGLAGLIMDLSRLNTSPDSGLIMAITANCMLLLVGFGLTAVSDIIIKGENIKRENDLTI